MILTEAFISHQIWLQRNASNEVGELLPFVEKMRDEVRAQVLAFGDESRTRRNLEAMLRDLDRALAALSDGWAEQLTLDLRNFAEYETQWTLDTLALNVDANFTSPSPEQVWSAAQFNPLALGGAPTTLGTLVSSWGDNETARMVTGVKSGFVQGLTTRQIVKNVVGAGGLGDISERHAATVIRTALNQVSTQARETVYKKNSDIIQKYEIVATLDSRTSTTCRGLDGQQYEIGKGPLPPFHGNCRTTTKPVISSEYDFLDKGAKRAARGAEGGTQVDGGTTYYEFLKAQPAWFQDEALGPVRGKLFRNSGLTPEEFRAASVDGFGRPLTLAQMSELDARVAEYLKTQ